MNPIKAAKHQVSTILQDAFIASGLGTERGELSGSVQIPRDATHGDFAANHAMVAAKHLKMPPRDIADKLVSNLSLDGSSFTSVSVAGPGFINFTLTDKWYGEILHLVEKMGQSFGRLDIGGGKKVMVEFVSANPTGPMTIGNARGGVLGDTLASVLSWAGYDVWREFLVNDTGNQIRLFGRSIDARYRQICHGKDSCVFPDDGYHGDDIIEIAREIYDMEADSLCSLSEDERIERFVSFALPRNIELMKQHLQRYGISFDEWFLESSLHDSGEVERTLKKLEKSGLTYEKDGALWLRNTQLGAEKDEVLRKANGFYTYYTFDIPYHKNKQERGFEKVIDIWGADHHGHAKRLKGMLCSQEIHDALGVDGDIFEFVIMQMVRLTRDGEVVKVSKRTGKALTLNDLLDEITVDAARFFFGAKPDSHLDFDLGLALRQDSENPVYYVQYAHARICSLVKMLSEDGTFIPSYNDISAFAPSKLSSNAERELIRQISLFPDEIESAAMEYDPSRINKYAVELAAKFHKFYTECKIRGVEHETKLSRLKLADTTRVVIRNALTLLGISAPEKM